MELRGGQWGKMMDNWPQVNNGEGDVVKSLEQTFCGGSVCTLVLGSRIETNNFFVSLSQFTTNSKLKQDDDPQGQQEQPSQTADTLLIMQENRPDVEVATFEAGNGLLQAGLLYKSEGALLR